MFRRVRDSLDLLIVKFLAIVIFFYILKHFFLYNALKRAHMVAYFYHHLSDNYVDLSDLYVDLSDLIVDLSDLYVDLSLIPSVEK